MSQGNGPGLHNGVNGMDAAKELLIEAGLTSEQEGECVRVVSKRVAKKIIAIEAVRQAREEGKQELLYNARPFVLCGLPVRRPKKGTLLHVRRNGKYFLRVAGDPEFGLPFGQDRLIPLWVATLAIRQKSRVVQFDAAAELLETFGLAKDGRAYRRLVDGFKRIFASTIFFGTEEQLKKAVVWEWSRFHFFDTLQVWYTPAVNQRTFADDQFRNTIVLSEVFWNDLQEHPIPLDLGVIRAFANSPGLLDFYMWLAWRCWRVVEVERVPLFGNGGLSNQLGIESGQGRSKFRQIVRRWLDSLRAVWGACPAEISDDGNFLILKNLITIEPHRSS